MQVLRVQATEGRIFSAGVLTYSGLRCQLKEQLLTGQGRLLRGDLA